MIIDVPEPTVPGHMTGFLKPVPNEIEAVDLPVTGALPPELEGLYVRNGANALPGMQSRHHFNGQGMVHGVQLGKGRAAWYRNRWVRTPAMTGAQAVRPDGSRDLTVSVANTAILEYAGKTLALVENCLPFELTPELDTLGPYDFGGALQGPMTAHPKTDPRTGELYFFGYSPRPPFLVYHVASREGRLLRSVPIEVSGPTMMHDFALTEHHVVWLDLPVIFDRELIGRVGMPYRWSDEYPARIGLMPREGGSADVRWFSVPPGYAFHVGNAYENGQGQVVVDAVHYDRTDFNRTWKALGGLSLLPGSDEGLSTGGGGRLTRWTLDLATGKAHTERLDDLAVEFPTLHPSHCGRANHFLYAVSSLLKEERGGSHIVRYDLRTGQRASHVLEPGWIPGEAVFVPAEGATAEDHGWLLSLVTHATEDRAQLLVQDASTLEPVAAVTLPRRVPTGFHGAWLGGR